MTRSIFISGGGSGIGRAVAQRFAKAGWRIGLGDISEGGMAETLATLAGEGHSAHRLDVRDVAQWHAALGEFGAGGPIHAVFNNAGVAHGGPLIELSEDEIDRLLDVNLRGVINGARAAHPWLRAAGPGSCLLNTASAAALYGIAGTSVYSATKFGVRAMTEALDTEWREDGIAVRSLMPGFIDTPLLAAPPNAGAGSSTMRDNVEASGLPFIPISEVAEAAWQAVHGRKLHTLVGKTARQIAFAARWMPGKLRTGLVREKA